jgi:hypothetical protein
MHQLYYTEHILLEYIYIGIMLMPILSRARAPIMTILDDDNEIVPLLKMYQYVIDNLPNLINNHEKIVKNLVGSSFKLLEHVKEKNKPELENIIYEYFEKIITTVQNMHGFDKHNVVELERLHQSNIDKNAKLQERIIELRAELDEYDYLPLCGCEYNSLMTTTVFDMYKAFNILQNDHPSVKTKNFFGLFVAGMTTHSGLFTEMNKMTKQQENERTSMYCEIENLELRLKMVNYKLTCGSKYLALIVEDFPDLNVHSFEFFKTFLNK